MSRHIYVLLTLAILIGACTAGYQPDPLPAFRSVLDEQPRMLTLKLQENFWVAYSAENGGLYRVWRDGVDLDGAVYTTAHGPQPTSQGPAYIVNPIRDDQWQLTRDGNTLATNVQFKGHSFENGQVTLHIQLTTDEGLQIAITESPIFTQDDTGNVGLKRVFQSTNILKAQC